MNEQDFATLMAARKDVAALPLAVQQRVKQAAAAIRTQVAGYGFAGVVALGLVACEVAAHGLADEQEKPGDGRAG